ncbi:sulfurtransferase [Ectothiorhodospiraceae bacterium BW-2]|nr:sulfurtransferase [Ectothiorhodospiraceae bacterium BW-2]
MQNYPRLLEPEQLQHHLKDPQLRLVNLCDPRRNLPTPPGAVTLDYEQLVRQLPPVGGLLPNNRQLSTLFSKLGLTPAHHIVAYDDEGGGKACRLLWTLACIGHPHFSLLNGGAHAWLNEDFPLATTPYTPQPTHYEARFEMHAPAHADHELIMAHLGDDDFALVDARSAEEFSGLKRFASRGGHIPGALWLEWTELMDHTHHLRLKPRSELEQIVTRLGLSRDQTVVSYCQTHHRSSLNWFVLDYLGFQSHGYEGSWSDWGNRPDTPIELGPPSPAPIRH